MEEKLQAVVVHQEYQGHLQKQQEFQQFFVMMMHFVKKQKLMPSSTLVMVQLMHSEETNTLNSQRMLSLMVTLKQFLKDGLDFQVESMPLLLIRMVRRTSSRDQSIGDTTDVISMENILKKLMKDSLVFRTTLTPLWFGVETARFISTREANSGDLIHLKDHQSRQHTQNQLAIGKAFLIALMLPYNIQTVTLTSLRVTNIIDLTIERLR